MVIIPERRIARKRFGSAMATRVAGKIKVPDLVVPRRNVWFGCLL